LFYLDEHPATFVVFYVRRFIIQPLFIILFIPAFYYQKRQ
jgi:exosortase F-associated protein